MSKKGLDDRPVSQYEEFALSVVRRSHLPSLPSAGGLFGKGFATAKLEVEAEQDILYLRPTVPDTPPGPDELLKGSVTLYLPKQRKLKGLTISMIGRYDITWPPDSGRSPAYENGLLSERKVSMLAEKDVLELAPGSHTFEFDFLVPANSACWERCIHGRVRYSLIAHARLSSSLPSSSSDLSSDPKTFYLVPNPGGPLAELPMPPPSLLLHTEGYFDDLGPWSAELQSQHCTVGGLLLIRINLPAPPVDILLHSIKITILQTFFLTSPRKQNITDSTTLRVNPAAHVVTILDSTNLPNSGSMQDDGRGSQRRNLDRRAAPMAVARSGEGAEVVHLARFPNDNVLRPTTRIGTDTPIRIHHLLEVEVLYRQKVAADEEGSKERESRSGWKGKVKGKGKDKADDEIPELKKVKISKPIELFSCLNFVDSLTLPQYEANDPNPLSLDEGINTKVPCACGLTITELLEKHGSTLLSSLRSPADSTTSASFPGLNPRSDSSSSLSPIKPDDARLILSPSVSTGVVRRDSDSISRERTADEVETETVAMEWSNGEPSGEKSG